MRSSATRWPEAEAGGGGRLELHGVAKRYGTVMVLQPLDLSVEDGEFLTILGPSGSGKTTILRLIGGFTEPTAGRITLDGRDITDLPIFRRPFNTVFQDYALFPHMTVRENVGYGLMVRHLPKAVIRERVDEVLKVVALAALAERYPAQLSGGQKQRVALARAIVCRPKVVLLDEPLAALDAELRRQMQLFLKRLQRQIRITFLFVTHDQDEAITMSDRIAVMSDGRLEQLGAPREIYYRPRTPFVAGFFGDNNLIEGTVAGRARAKLVLDTTLGRLAVPGEAATGTRALVAVRPESVRLLAGDGGPGIDIVLRGTVEEVTFVGASSQVAVRVGEGTGALIRLKLQSAPGPDPVAPGAAVTIGWAAQDAALVPV
ncbi:MAG: ABC transporter ATP-binding protein [Rhodospirillaceae bacterium]|nr:ABC transporter ATP-binding protein [Rhodospirillaceae bacterium]